MLSTVDILENIKKKEIIITPFDKAKISTVSIDLTVNTFVKPIIDSHIYLNSKELPKIHYSKFENGSWIEPNETLTFCTYEQLYISTNLSGIVSPRSSLAKLPVIINNSLLIDPGFCGVLTGNITNKANVRIFVPKYYRILQVMFFSTKNSLDYGTLPLTKNQGNSYQDACEIKIDKEWRS